MKMVIDTWNGIRKKLFTLKIEFWKIIRQKTRNWRNGYRHEILNKKKLSARKKIQKTKRKKREDFFKKYSSGWFTIWLILWDVNLFRLFYATIDIYIRYDFETNSLLVTFSTNQSSFVCAQVDHHHVVPPARISLTLSRHFSLSFIASGRSSGLHPVSLHSCCM